MFRLVAMGEANRYTPLSRLVRCRARPWSCTSAVHRTLTIALTFEVLFLGLSLTAELLERGAPKRQAVLVPIGASLAIVVGAVGGAALLGHASGAVLSAVLAFGCAALLYLVTEELLTEAHETEDTDLHVIVLFVGLASCSALKALPERAVDLFFYDLSS